MAAPLKAAMPPTLDIGGGYTIRFDAVSLTTGSTITPVVVSNARIFTDTAVSQDAGGGGGGTTTTGPYMLVPGPDA